MLQWGKHILLPDEYFIMTAAVWSPHYPFVVSDHLRYESAHHRPPAYQPAPIRCLPCVCCVLCVAEPSVLCCVSLLLVSISYIRRRDNGKRDLEPMDVPLMKNSTALFARKFNPNANDVLSVMEAWLKEKIEKETAQPSHKRPTR